MNPKLTLVAAKHGGVFSRHDALRSGYTPGQIRERLRRGRWTPVRRGYYCEAVDLSQHPSWEQHRIRHRLAIHAVSRALGRGAAVVSHQSALVVHGLPTWGLDLRQVHVTRRDKANGRTEAGVRHHQGRGLNAENIAEVQGVSVTSVPRAVMETACISRYEPTVAIMDAALNQQLATAQDLAAAVEEVRGWPGSGTALAAFDFADGRAESVGESRLRVLMDNYGLPTPKLQNRFANASGTIGARVDFYFRDQAVIIEFDGRVKYRDNAPEVVFREKQREDRLRAGGAIVVRVTWDDLDHPLRVVMRIRHAFAQAEQAGLTSRR